MRRCLLHEFMPFNNEYRNYIVSLIARSVYEYIRNIYIFFFFSIERRDMNVRSIIRTEVSIDMSIKLKLRSLNNLYSNIMKIRIIIA